MFQIRRAADRVHTSQGWRDTYHSFSLAGGLDGAHPPIGALCALNDDRIAPTRGFGMQPHRDTEIVTYVLDGALAHRDSMGNGSIVRSGGVQRMSAGTGIVCSAYNASRVEPLHVMQVWLAPAGPGGRPGSEEKQFDMADKRGALRLIASPDGRDGSVSIGADARIHAALIDGDEAAMFEVQAGRRIYIHVARGSVAVNGEPLAAGDGARIEAVETVSLTRGEAAEVLLFDLA